jgi:hypothetical protein
MVFAEVWVLFRLFGGETQQHSGVARCDFHFLRELI